MKIIVTGGGSGGHITPILAVAHELKRQQPGIEIIYIGQRGDKLGDIPAADPNIDEVYAISAGKLRRYANEGWRQLLDLPSQARNIRDMFRVAAGIWQSYWLLRRLRPDVVFTRGGFVSVPVALGGKLNGIPYVTHDSDSTPSLANRLIARWASLHAVALPKDVYPYDQTKTVTLGVPINTEYQPVTSELRRRYREELNLGDGKVVLLTGGGNGAQVLNDAMIANAKYLLGTFPDVRIVHVAGRAHEAMVSQAYDALGLGNARQRVMVLGFVSDFYKYSGASDVVIARGGATNLAEFAAQGVACLIVPSKQLSWNVRNAEVLASRNAIAQLNEDQIEQPERFGRTIAALLEDDDKRAVLATTLAQYAHPNAAADLAKCIVDMVSGGGVDATRQS